MLKLLVLTVIEVRETSKVFDRFFDTARVAENQANFALWCDGRFAWRDLADEFVARRWLPRSSGE